MRGWCGWSRGFQGRRPGGEEAYRPGWGLGPLLWGSWKLLEVWGIGRCGLTFTGIPLTAALRIDLGRGRGGGQEAVAGERCGSGRAMVVLSSGSYWLEFEGFVDRSDVERRALGSPQALPGWLLSSLGSFDTSLPSQHRRQPRLGSPGPSPALREAHVPLGSALPHPGWGAVGRPLRASVSSSPQLLVAGAASKGEDVCRGPAWATASPDLFLVDGLQACSVCCPPSPSQLPPRPASGRTQAKANLFCTQSLCLLLPCGFSINLGINRGLIQSNPSPGLKPSPRSSQSSRLCFRQRRGRGVMLAHPSAAITLRQGLFGAIMCNKSLNPYNTSNK